MVSSPSFRLAPLKKYDRKESVCVITSADAHAFSAASSVAPDSRAANARYEFDE